MTFVQQLFGAGRRFKDLSPAERLGYFLWRQREIRRAARAGRRTLVEQLFGVGKRCNDLTETEFRAYRAFLKTQWRANLPIEKRAEILVKQRKRSRQYYVEHAEESLRAWAVWSRTHPEKRRAYRRGSYQKNRERYCEAGRLRYHAEPPEVHKSRLIYRRAVDNGTLVMPEMCERCQKRKARLGHHEDYSKPLQVVWLCPQCHKDVHGRTKYTDEELGIRIDGVEEAE
jgi:hypothetical protein